MTPKPILLVEDDRQLRDALAETLRLSGFRVLSAGNGAEALQVLAGTAVAAVVTDYQMEPMDGSALLARIRERWPQLPVLMITAYGSIEHAVASMMAGASDYLVKPFAAQTLVTRLERLVPRELAPPRIYAGVKTWKAPIIPVINRKKSVDDNIGRVMEKNF